MADRHQQINAQHPCESSVLLNHLPQPVVHDKVVIEARKKFAGVLDDEVLDYKHNHPVAVESCVSVLRKILGNVVDHPDEPKYKKIKATSNAFKNYISSHKGGEHLMILSGWTTQVVDYQKHWVFEAAEGSTKYKILHECILVLDKAMHTIHDKAERKKKEDDERKANMAAERERIRLQIEDDKLDRKIRNEVTAARPLVSPDTGEPGGGNDADAMPVGSPTGGPGHGHVLGVDTATVGSSGDE